MALQSSLMSGQNGEGVPLISVLTARLYQIRPTGRCIAREGEAALQNELEYYSDLPQGGRIQPYILKKDIDLYAFRLRTDLVVQGMIRSSRPARSLPITLSVSGSRTNFLQELIATGDRRVEWGAFGYQLSDAEPFTELPLRFDRAYGGVDERGEARHENQKRLSFIRQQFGPGAARQYTRFQYPRNPTGRAFRIDADALDGMLWPNLEFPQDRVTLDRATGPLENWPDRPYPAGFDWISHDWFPRCAHLGIFPATREQHAPQVELDLGIIDADIAHRPLLKRIRPEYAQGAHPYLWRHRLFGDERITISSLAEGAPLEIQLPKSPPFLAVTLAGAPQMRLEPQLDCVFVDAEQQQVKLVWRGSLAVSESDLGPGWEKRTDYVARW